MLQGAGTDTLCSVSSLGSILVFRSNLQTSSNKTSSNLLITFHLLGCFFCLFQKQDAQCWNSLTFRVGPLWDVTQVFRDSLSFSPSLSPCETLHSPRPAPDPHTAEKQLIAGGLQWLGAAGLCCVERIRNCTPSRGCALPYLFLEQKTLKLHLRSQCNIPSISRASSTTQPSTQGTGNSAKSFVKLLVVWEKKFKNSVPDVCL